MRPITILYGTETGNAEDCSEDLACILKKDGYDCRVLDMEDYNVNELRLERLLTIITSTYGNGEPPSNADLLLSHLLNDKPALEGVPFAVCGLGDTAYPLFSQCGKDFDKILAELGGKRVIDRVDCDYDFDAPFENFSNNLRAFLASQPETYPKKVTNSDKEEALEETVDSSSTVKKSVWHIFSR